MLCRAFFNGSSIFGSWRGASWPGHAFTCLRDPNSENRLPALHMFSYHAAGFWGVDEQCLWDRAARILAWQYSTVQYRLASLRRFSGIRPASEYHRSSHIATGIELSATSRCRWKLSDDGLTPAPLSHLQGHNPAFHYRDL